MKIVEDSLRQLDVSFFLGRVAFLITNGKKYL